MNTRQRIEAATAGKWKFNEIDNTLFCLTLRRKQEATIPFNPGWMQGLTNWLNMSEFRSWLKSRAVMRRRAR